MHYRLKSLVLCIALGACDGQPTDGAVKLEGPTASGSEEIVPAPKVQLAFGDKQLFRLGQDLAPFAMDGFGLPEEGGTWTMSKSVKLTLPISPEVRGKQASLIVSAIGYIEPSKLPSQVISITIGGKQFGEFIFTKPQDLSDLTIELPAEITASESLLLAFDIPNAASPQSLGDGQDVRMLGMFLNSIELKESTVTAAAPGDLPNIAPPPTAQ